MSIHLLEYLFVIIKRYGVSVLSEEVFYYQPLSLYS